MATYKDIDGSFKCITDTDDAYDATDTQATVGEIVGVTLEETGGAVETTAVGDGARTRDAAMTDFTLSGEFHYDPADAPQEDLAVGTKIEFDCLPGSGPAKTIGGLAVVTQVGLNIAGLDETTVKRSFAALLFSFAATP